MNKSTTNYCLINLNSAYDITEKDISNFNIVFSYP